MFTFISAISLAGLVPITVPKWTNRPQWFENERKNEIYLKSKIKDFSFNSIRVKADIFRVKEKNNVYKETKTTYENVKLKLLFFM